MKKRIPEIVLNEYPKDDYVPLQHNGLMNNFIDRFSEDNTVLKLASGDSSENITDYDDDYNDSPGIKIQHQRKLYLDPSLQYKHKPISNISEELPSHKTIQLYYKTLLKFKLLK